LTLTVGRKISQTLAVHGWAPSFKDAAVPRATSLGLIDGVRVWLRGGRQAVTRPAMTKPPVGQVCSWRRRGCAV